MSIKPHLQYLIYVLRHKFFVLIEGRKLGLGWWQLISHDLSKFSRAEWGPYVRFFYGPTPSSKTGGPVRKATPEFAEAWKHHWQMNPHHWEWWVDFARATGRINEVGIGDPAPMPDKYLREMLADWYGAGRALGKPDTAAWYKSQRDIIKLHPETRAWIEAALRTVHAGRRIARQTEP